MATKRAFALYLLASLMVMTLLASVDSFAVRVSSGEDDQQVTPGPEPGPQPRPVRPVPPRPNPLARLIDRVTIEGPYIEGGLSVFTLSTHASENNRNYLTLDEGVASGQLVIQELKGGGSVPTLNVKNTSSRWAFLMVGELVQGGKQNRTVRTDTLVPPKSSTWINLPVYCVEQHRWQGGRSSFASSAKAAAPNSVRSGINQGYDQSKVWEGVRKAQRDAGIKSATGDVIRLYSDPKTAKKIDDMTARIIRCIPRKQYVGLVIARGRSIISADLFANGLLCGKLREKIIRSHVVEEICRKRPSRHHHVPATRRQVRDFLNRIHGSQISRRPAPGGTGTTISISGRASGSGLEHGGRIIHGVLFPRIVVPIVRPTPMPRRRTDEP